MPCDSQANATPQKRAEQKDALARLAAALAAGTVQAVVGRAGGIAFKGWTEADRRGLSDVCAYRALMAQSSPELRRAIARAEAMAGWKLDERTIAAGMHSHDGGHSWGTH